MLGEGTRVNPFNSFFANGIADIDYALQDFKIDGFQVTAGRQSFVLKRFTFNDDSSRDTLSMGLGYGRAMFTPWDIMGRGVGTISILEHGWQPIRFRRDTPFSNSPDLALVFTNNFNVGTYTFDSPDNDFWGDSTTEGITLIISNDVIPEPTSALLLLLPATALLRRKLFC